ncbi:Os01g0153200 [Oryza sativa Japonica Group]|uniref:Os01g0153200 protein n=1 Tax=Oryza sativa subsp. japonica TaxID=39947 RepID=A0A0P0UYN6_ORYSJ|nr:Os01g0153200 [Oryza sativa Japonica Group]
MIGIQAVVKGYPSSRSHRRIWFVDDHKSGEIILEFDGRLNKWGVISFRSDVKVKKLSPGPQVSFPTHQSGYMPTSPSLLLPVPWIMIHERGKEKAYGRKCSGILLTERFILDDQ